MIDDVTLAKYEALVAAHPGLERKGAKIPYTSLNGHMFSFLTPDGMLALRLSPQDREAFVDQHASEPVIQHDTVMGSTRGWVDGRSAPSPRESPVMIPSP